MTSVVAALAAVVVGGEGRHAHAHRRHHLFDPAVLASADNAVTVVGQVTKSSKNPLLSEQEPWDGNWLNGRSKIPLSNQESARGH